MRDGRDSRLDDAIDDAARALTSGHPGPAFRDSVRDRLGAQRGAGSHAAWYVAAAAAAIIAIALLSWTPNRGDVEQVFTAGSGAVVDAAAEVAAPAATDVGQAVSGPTTTTASAELASPLAAAEPPLEVDMLDVMPLDVEQLEIPMIAVDALVGPVAAQGPTPPALPQGRGQPPAPAPKPNVPPPFRITDPLSEGQLENIRVDIVVTEEGGTAEPIRKTASVITGDRRPAAVRSQGESIRAQANVPGSPFPMEDRTMRYMKADIHPWIERNGRIRTSVTMEYLSPTSQQEERGTSLKFEPLLESGKPLRVSESTDPTSNRKVIVEVTATILK